jgi:hypothetical protein
MEAAYMRKTGQPKPALDEQGSDHYLALQYKQCAKGEIGYFTTKQIISQLPDPEETSATMKKRKRDREGIIHEADEEQRYDPVTIEQWKKQVMVFRTSLLMCMGIFPQFKQFDASKDDMDSFYKFLYGPDIASKSPAPTLRVLMITERKAWREIALLFHLGHRHRQDNV